MKNTSWPIRLTAFCSYAVLLVGLVSSTCFAQGKGGGKGGGGNDGGGELPSAPVIYDLQLLSFPGDYNGSNAHPQQMNLAGELVGFYGVVNGEQPFYVDVNAVNPAVINLNDVPLDTQYDVRVAKLLDHLFRRMSTSLLTHRKSSCHHGYRLS